MTLTIAESALRLLIAAALSGLIGFERETAQKSAGLRTHMLVGLGAALFTVLSIDAFGASDPARIAAQVVTGIGFLGAGVIWRQRGSVRGLTTAAGLWAVAAIGMAAGTGELLLAVVAAAIALAVLVGMRAVERAMANRKAPFAAIEVELESARHFDPVWELACRVDPSIEDVEFVRAEPGGRLRMRVDSRRVDTLVQLIEAMDGVEGARRI